MIDISFVSPINNLFAIDNNLIADSNVVRREVERDNGIGNPTKECLIVAMSMLCASITIDYDRNTTNTYSDYDTQYDFETINKTLQLFNMDISMFFTYFNLFN